MEDSAVRIVSLLALVCAVPLCLRGAIAGDDDYFPPSESNGGWRKNTKPDFVRSLGMDPDALERFGQYNLSVKDGSGNHIYNEGNKAGNAFGSYIHVHFGSNPKIADNFLNYVRTVKKL